MFATGPGFEDPAFKQAYMQRAMQLAMLQQQGQMRPDAVANPQPLPQQAPPVVAQAAPPLAEVAPAPIARPVGVDLQGSGGMFSGAMVPQNGLVVDQPGTGAAPQVLDKNSPDGLNMTAAPVPIKGHQDFLQLPGHNASMSLGGMMEEQPDFFAPPPTTPEEVQQRKSEWVNLFSTMQQNPAMMLALMRVGADLMQPMPIGQTEAGHFGKAVSGGLDYLQAYEGDRVRRGLMEAQTKQAIAGAGLTGAQTETEAQRPEQIRAQTAKIKQDVSTDLANLGFKKQELALLEKKFGVDSQVSAAQIAKALQEVKESQDLTPTKKFQLEAYGKWLLRRQSGTNANGSGSAVVQRMETLYNQYIAMGMPEEVARKRATALGGEGAAGGKSFITDEQAFTRLESMWDEWSGSPDIKKQFPKFEEYVKDANSDLMDDEDKMVKNRSTYYAKKYGEGRAKEGAKAPAPGGAASPDRKAAPREAAPMGAGGIDAAKLKKGTMYTLPNGQELGVWNGTTFE